MSVKLGPSRRISIQAVAWSPNPGHFAKCHPGNKQAEWIIRQFHHCRETFQGAFDRKQKHILFCYGRGERDRIVKFIRKVEKKLGVSPHTAFGPTQLGRIMWIEVSSFWLQHPMRRSLFTALLRAGRNYKRKFKKALFSVPYTDKTRKAVKKFLRGYTYYRGSYDADLGWAETFDSRKEVKKLAKGKVDD